MGKDKIDQDIPAIGFICLKAVFPGAKLHDTNCNVKWIAVITINSTMYFLSILSPPIRFYFLHFLVAPETGPCGLLDTTVDETDGTCDDGRLAGLDFRGGLDFCPYPSSTNLSYSFWL